ncbi:MAG: polysaccharide biosynthesis protein [Clostridia bacterium]|nr:polysaccharide biosynthesis protein [Clostridia bacterium]
MNNKTTDNAKKNVSDVKPKKFNIRWMLVFFDMLVFIACAAALYFTGGRTSLSGFPYFAALAYLVLLYIFRFVFKIYSQVWRYGGISAYLKLILADAFACVCAVVLSFMIPGPRYSVAETVSLIGVDLLLLLSARIIYGFCYKYCASDSFIGKTARFLLGLFGIKEQYVSDADKHTVNIIIVGAGKDGIALSEALAADDKAIYKPVFFVDVKEEKIGRRILDVEIISEQQVTRELLSAYGVAMVVFAIPDMSVEKKKELYEKYKAYGCLLKVYEKSSLLTSESGGVVKLREFEIEDLLFRNVRQVADERVVSYYKGKTILVTGGGGSIGSELCRQIAEMDPRMIIILDIYENSAYDIQQELLQKYKNRFETKVEIASVCNKDAIEKVFRAYQPQIVLHAAAHKHVPLMEKNCVEAVLNNVFGTYNVVLMSEKYKVEHFIMISTDKAVNPTNVMGATKRVCEMITRCFANHDSGTIYSATRFGNVLGSAGSVIPLFKRQIANGGPVTVTDKRINRYFMTIPEASQLVLQSGTMAKNGELFVLDMGQPVKILDLAENMIRLSGYIPYKDIDIIETGLRPGEKLYEELLVKSEELDKTESNLIFIERDVSLTDKELEEKLAILRDAVDSGSDEEARHALKTVVPTYRAPAEVNGEYDKEKETANA